MLALMANVIAPIHFVYFSWATPLVTARSSCLMVLNWRSICPLDLGLYVGVGSCRTLNALHILCTSWLTNSLSQTRTSRGPILYVQLLMNASITCSWDLLFIAITMTKAEK